MTMKQSQFYSGSQQEARDGQASHNAREKAIAYGFTTRHENNVLIITPNQPPTATSAWERMSVGYCENCSKAHSLVDGLCYNCRAACIACGSRDIRRTCSRYTPYICNDCGTPYNIERSS